MDATQIDTAIMVEFRDNHSTREMTDDELETAHLLEYADLFPQMCRPEEQRDVWKGINQ